MTDYGILSLLRLWQWSLYWSFYQANRSVSLLVGTLVGAVMLYGTGFAKPWLDVVYGVMGADLWIWLVLVCGFFGGLVALFEASGGIHGFTAIAAKVCKGEKRTLVASWILGIVTFVDDWLSILSVGTAIRRATDRFHIPREMLAFLSNATATSICVIVPTSTWGVFMISQLVATDVCTSEAGMSTFVQVLPFLFYPLVALLCGFLYSVGILPKIGPMRKAYAPGQGADSSCRGIPSAREWEETPRAQFPPPHCAGHGGHHPHPGDPVWHPTLFGVLRAPLLAAKASHTGAILEIPRCPVLKV